MASRYDDSLGTVFSDQSAFLRTVNQWIRDGSNLVDFVSTPELMQVTLVGRDGGREELTFLPEEERT